MEIFDKKQSTSVTPLPPFRSINYGSTEERAIDTANHKEDFLDEVSSQQEKLFPSPTIMDIDEAIELLGMGKFQFEILLAAGLCFAADAMEILLLSFLAVILRVEWELDERQSDTILSTVYGGALIGTLVLSPLADLVGRQPIFTATAALIAIFGVGTAFCPNYEWLLFARFMVGVGVGGLNIPFDTLAEFIPISHRGTNLLYIEFFWTGGTLLVPVFAWWSFGRAGEDASWEQFVALCAIPCALSTILGLILVPESPRWLLTQGKHEKALEILRIAAGHNGLDGYQIFPEGTLIMKEASGEHDELNLVASFRELLSPKWLNTTLRLWGTWFGLEFLYFGTVIAVSLVFARYEDGNVDAGGGVFDFDYSAIFISASSEILGLVLVLCTVDKWGRIPTQVTTYLMGGICCLLLGFFAVKGETSRTLLVVLSFLARMSMMGATSTTWVATPEIFSTSLRATGHGTANALGRLGGLLCPYIITEGTSLPLIGIVLFVVSFATARISGSLPETAGKSLGKVRIPS